MRDDLAVRRGPRTCARARSRAGPSRSSSGWATSWKARWQAASKASWSAAVRRSPRHASAPAAAEGAASYAEPVATPSRPLRVRCRAMAIGIITGSGTYSLPGFEGSGPEPVATPWGDALVSRGTFAGTEVLHVSRHEAATRGSRTSSRTAPTSPRSPRWAPTGVLAVTVCGAVDPSVELGSMVCFDDLHFLANRLGDGELCTFYPEPGDPRRGHWIFEDPFSADLRRALLDGRGRGRRRDPRRRLLRPRRRAALQHQGRDPRARRLRRDRRLPDGRARRPCCAGRPSCPTRCSATRPTTPTASRTRRRRCRRCST